MRTFTPRNARGFTLIELMVVLVLMALAATAVIVTLRPPDHARAEAVMLAGKIAALRDQAVLRGRPTGIWITPSGYSFEEFRDTEWQPIAADGFDRQVAFRSGVTARTGQGRAGLRFDNLGLPGAPTVITLTDRDNRSATISVGANGAVEAL